MNDCSNLETKTSHDLMRDAVNRYCLTEREIVDKIAGQHCDCLPAVDRITAARLTGYFLNGAPCPTVVACAITGLIADSMTATRQ